MRPGTWALLCLVATAILAGAVTLGVRAFQQWREANTWEMCGPYKCRGPAEVLPKVEEVVRRAWGCLLEPGMVMPPMYLRIVVWPTETTVWAGQTVAGLTHPEGDGVYTVYVGRSLSALPHELAHVAELELTGETDMTHTSPAWIGPGGWFSKLEGCR